DGAGEYRDNERGAPIDASGSLDGHDFTSPQGLAQALHDDPALPACLVQRLYGYAVGGLEKSDTQDMLPYLKQSFAQEGYRLPNLVRTIALSHAFADVSAPPPAAPSTAGAPPEHTPQPSAK